MRPPLARAALGHVARTLAIVALSALVPAAGRLAAQAPATTDTRPTVAVMHFTNGAIFQHEAFDPLSTGITELLIHELAQNDSVRVVEREQLQKVLAELGLNASDRVDQATATRIGRLVGAQHVILGGFVVDLRGRTMVITARAVHTEQGVVTASQKVEGKPNDALGLVAELGQRLNTRVHHLPMPERPPSGDGGGEGRFDAVLLYSRALVAQDRGDLRQAAELFRAALARHPEYPQARAALARLDGSD